MPLPVGSIHRPYSVKMSYLSTTTGVTIISSGALLGKCMVAAATHAPREDPV